jgi:hypothetical protein
MGILFIALNRLTIKPDFNQSQSRQNEKGRGLLSQRQNQQEKSAMSEDPQGFSRLSQDMPG